MTEFEQNIVFVLNESASALYDKNGSTFVTFTI